MSAWGQGVQGLGTFWTCLYSFHALLRTRSRHRLICDKWQMEGGEEQRHIGGQTRQIGGIRKLHARRLG